MKPTADLCDELGADVRVLEPGLWSCGGLAAFGGPVTTVRVYEDNALVRTALESPGGGRVLVVDGGGSVRTALVGGLLGKLAERNGWAGVVVWGAVRDSAELAACAVGIRARATNPTIKTILDAYPMGSERTTSADVDLALGNVSQVWREDVHRARGPFIQRAQHLLRAVQLRRWHDLCPPHRCAKTSCG